MIPVTQSKTGSVGTCFRSCIASILELREADVPDINDFSSVGWQGAVDDFLWERGLSYRRVPIDSARPVGWSTIEGVSPRGGLHACVAYDGELVHDPHPQDGTGRGLVEPRYYGLLEAVRGGHSGMPTMRSRDEGFDKRCATCGAPLQNKMKVLTCQACRYEQLQKSAGKPIDKRHAESIRKALRKHGTDRADMATLRRNTTRQGGQFFMQVTEKDGRERTLPVKEVEKV